MDEATLKNNVLKMIRKEFPGAWVYHPSDKWRKGIPDLLILHNGKYLWIELKTEKGIVSKIQRKTMLAICKSGGKTCVCRSVSHVRTMIKFCFKITE